MNDCCFKAVKDYIKKADVSYAKNSAFGVSFEGLRCVAINTLHPSDGLFDGIWHADYDAEIAFGWGMKEWIVLLTSKTIDLLYIAKKYDGGGQPHACGFVCKELPFELPGGE